MTDTLTDVPEIHMMEDAQAAWNTKEGMVERDPKLDITPVITFYRDGEKIAIFMAARVNKHDAIAAVQIGVSMLDADEVTVSMDTHISNVTINPATGEQWKTGEMQKACDEDGACSIGIITDTILTLLLGRDIPTSMLNRKYHVNEEKGEVHWIDPWDFYPAGDMTGYVVESMADAFTERGMPPFPFPNPPEGMTETEHRVHRNITGLRLLATVVGGGLVPLELTEEHGEMYLEYLTEEMCQSDYENPLLKLLIPMLRNRFNLDETT